jgi:hypothetical protein
MTDMKNIFSKVITICLAVSILISLIGCDNLSGNPSQGLEFALTGNGVGYDVVGIGSCTDKNVVIPDEYEGLPVLGVEDNAFLNCGFVESIKLPKTVNYVSQYAFVGCTSLTKIEASEESEYFQSIDGNLYTKDAEVLRIYAPGKTEKSFAVPSGVKVIGANAFCGCTSLKSVSILSSLYRIEAEAFSGCTSLTEIRFDGSVGQWEQVKLSLHWDINTGEYMIYCTDGTISK